MARCKFVCHHSTKRLLVQQDPVTKAQISAFVFDAKFQIAKESEDNKAMFVGTHGAALEFVACSQPFEAGKEYYLDITPAETPA